jgi:hypothetical protein
LMYTTDGGQSWTKAIEYNRATHCVWLLNSSRGIADELYFAVEDLVKKRRVVYRVADSLG